MLREFEGRSHEEIGDALGVIAAAGQGADPPREEELPPRLGPRAASVAASRRWPRSSSCRRSGCPGSSASCWQPAHDVVASATATAQQAAVQVTAAPAVTQGAVSMADKVTAAAITVIVAGTVSVGAVDPARAEAVEAHAR